MKNWVLATISAILFLGCNDKSEITYKTIEESAAFLSLKDIRASFAQEDARDIIQPGNIYVYKDWLLINEKYDGFHVVDNSNPASPVRKSYLRIPGSTDAIVRNDILYVNSGPDLLILDISNMAAVKEIKRFENAFFDLSKSNGDMYLIGFVQKEVVKKYYSHRGWDYCFGCMEDVQTVSSESDNRSGQGQGGSLARFAMAGNYLYFVDDDGLIPIDITMPSNPVLRTAVPLNRGTIETIYLYKDYLFIGSMNGVFIADYKTNPAVPKIISNIQHIRSCDPVVVQNDIAFSTLSAGSRCGGGNNELMVLDVQNAANPIILAEYFFPTTPLGLGVQDNNLFLCMGNGGLKWFNSENLKEITSNQIGEDAKIHARDVIVIGNHLIVTGDQGIVQYEFAGNTLTRLSTLF